MIHLSRRLLSVVVLVFVSAALFLPRTHLRGVVLALDDAGLPNDDRVQHLGLGGAVALVLALLWPPAGARIASSTIALGVVAISFGAAAELVQPRFGRSGQVSDLMFHSVGAMTALAVAAISGAMLQATTLKLRRPEPVAGNATNTRRFDT